MTDILLDETFDLIIGNEEGLDKGDFQLAESTKQHQALLLLANKGEFRQSPLVGVGVNLYLEDDRLGAMKSELQQQLFLDGMTVDQLRIFNDGQVFIDASYE